MRFQVYSDIHLELYPKTSSLWEEFPTLFQANAEVLFLVGDIGKLTQPTKLYTMFLYYVATHWKQVFYVLGNHEFYHTYHDWSKMLDMYTIYFSEFEKIHPNFHFLDNSVWNGVSEETGEKYEVLGCTLWSNVDISTTHKLHCFDNILEYDNTFDNKQGLSIDTYNEWNIGDKEWIMKSYNPSREKITFIMTHYPMTQNNTSNPIYQNENKMIKNLFANSMEKELNSIAKQCLYNGDDDIQIQIPHTFCLAGHTHYSYCKKDDNGFVWISNQMGYIDDMKNGSSGFNSNTIYDTYMI